MEEPSANRDIRRPDWMHIARSQAFANLWRKGYRAYENGLTLVRMCGTDELHATGGDWRTVFPEDRLAARTKAKEQYALPGKPPRKKRDHRCRRTDGGTSAATAPTATRATLTARSPSAAPCKTPRNA